MSSSKARKYKKRVKQLIEQGHPRARAYRMAGGKPKLTKLGVNVSIPIRQERFDQLAEAAKFYALEPQHLIDIIVKGFLEMLRDDCQTLRLPVMLRQV